MTFMRRRRRRRRPHLLMLAFALFLLLSASSAATESSIPSPRHLDPSSGGQHRTSMEGVSGADQALRPGLRGLGSSPPSCRSKCGNCWPCTPVHVSIQPGLSMPLEYYPEAWRCKCGNKLFMP